MQLLCKLGYVRFKSYDCTLEITLFYPFGFQILAEASLDAETMVLSLEIANPRTSRE